MKTIYVTLEIADKPEFEDQCRRMERDGWYRVGKVEQGMRDTGGGWGEYTNKQLFAKNLN